jgi:hypothetical protein
VAPACSPAPCGVAPTLELPANLASQAGYPTLSSATGCSLRVQVTGLVADVPLLSAAWTVALSPAGTVLASGAASVAEAAEGVASFVAPGLTLTHGQSVVVHVTVTSASGLQAAPLSSAPLVVNLRQVIPGVVVNNGGAQVRVDAPAHRSRRSLHFPCVVLACGWVGGWVGGGRNVCLRTAPPGFMPSLT